MALGFYYFILLIARAYKKKITPPACAGGRGVRKLTNKIKIVQVTF